MHSKQHRPEILENLLVWGEYQQMNVRLELEPRRISCDCWVELPYWVELNFLTEKMTMKFIKICGSETELNHINKRIVFIRQFVQANWDEFWIINRSTSAGKSVSNFFNLLEIDRSSWFAFGDVAKREQSSWMWDYEAIASLDSSLDQSSQAELTPIAYVIRESESGVKPDQDVLIILILDHKFKIKRWKYDFLMNREEIWEEQSQSRWWSGWCCNSGRSKQIKHSRWGSLWWWA